MMQVMWHALIIKTLPIPVVMIASGTMVTRILAVYMMTMTSLHSNAAHAVVSQLISALSTNGQQIQVATHAIGTLATRALAACTITITSLPTTAALVSTHHQVNSMILLKMTQITLPKMTTQPMRLLLKKPLQNSM